MALKPFDQLSKSQQGRRRKLGITDDGRGKHGKTPKGADHYNWKGGQSTSSHGYRKIQVGVGHPLADPNGYAYEHHIVLGRRPKPGYVVHHENEDKVANEPDNLDEITRSEHSRLHNATRARDQSGRFISQ